jgi:hypothetical protein
VNEKEGVLRKARTKGRYKCLKMAKDIKRRR